MDDAVKLRGPWRFYLRREPGGRVADGVRFADDSCVLHWNGTVRSTSVYASVEDCESVHGHGEETHFVWLDPLPSDAFVRGAHDCYQDVCEGCPWASVTPGATKACASRPVLLVAPKYIKESDIPDYLAGYAAQAGD
jgi:hypothetical protein